MDKRILYIDCDGVVFDTINAAYEIMEENGLDHTNRELANLYFKIVDWNKLIEHAGILDNAIENIHRIVESGLFKEVKILTKLCGNETEEMAKKMAFDKLLPGIEVVTVKLNESKAEMVNAKDNVLVDDYIKNINEWRNMGGIGILYDNNDEVVNYHALSSLELLSNPIYVKRLVKTRKI